MSDPRNRLRQLPTDPLKLAEVVKGVRRFADGFKTADGYDLRAIRNKGAKALTRYKLDKLRQYYRTISEVQNRPHQVMRPRNKKRLRELQIFAQHQKLLKGIKVAFFPVTSDDKIKIIWKKDKPYKIVTPYGDVQKFFFDREKLAADPAGTIRRMMNDIPADFNYFFIMNGENQLKQGDDRINTEWMLNKLWNRYGGPDTPASVEADEDDPNSHYFANWLMGVEAIKVPNRKTGMALSKARYETRTDQKRLRKLIRSWRDALRKKRKWNSRLEKEFLETLTKINSDRADKGLPMYSPDDLLP